MQISLRNGVVTEQPEKVILQYYKEMGSGVRTYDDSFIPGTGSIREQLMVARELANRLGGRGIPSKAIDDLCAKQSAIARKLDEVPSTITILDEDERIPWKSITDLFAAFRVRYVTIARYTKMLHKIRPNLIPILDSHVRDDYFLPTLAKGTIAGLSEAERATYLVREMKKDVYQNRKALLRLCEWQGKPYNITIVRILDILIWCRFGPFQDRFAGLYT